MPAQEARPATSVRLACFQRKCHVFSADSEGLASDPFVISQRFGHSCSHAGFLCPNYALALVGQCADFLDVFVAAWPVARWESPGFCFPLKIAGCFLCFAVNQPSRPKACLSRTTHRSLDLIQIRGRPTSLKRPR